MQADRGDPHVSLSSLVCGRMFVQLFIVMHRMYVPWQSLRGENWLMRPIFPETTIEVGPVPLVPYAEPLTERLAENFVPFLTNYNSFLTESYGLVTMSRGGIQETLMLVELLEMSAQSILLALRAGEIKELDRQAVKDLSNTMYTRGLPLFGAPGNKRFIGRLVFWLIKLIVQAGSHLEVWG